MRTPLACLASAVLATGATLALSASSTTPAERSVEAILRSYVEDFREDAAAAVERVFGVRVDGEDGGEWTVAVSGARSADDAWGVELDEGAPSRPTFVYTLDADTLRAIDAGRLNALTAQGKAFPGDESPMDVEFQEGAEPSDVNAFSFHFWTRGFPERVPFRQGLTRVVHGVDVVPLYYQPGLRTIWSSIGKGQRANNGPGQPIVLPFPAMVVVIRGRALGLLADRQVEARAGEVIFIPPGTPYEWWNEDDEPAEALLLFFGEGA